MFKCLDLSSLTEDSVPNTKASKVFSTADLMLRKLHMAGIMYHNTIYRVPR